MRRLRLAVLVAATMLTSACDDLVSIHALYTPEDRVADPSIEGTWQHHEDQLVVERRGDAYRMTLQNKKDPKESAVYDVHLVDLGGVRFADLLLDDSIGHMIVRARVTDGKLRFAFLDSKWLRDRVPHENVVGANRTRAVLTLRTPALRALATKYAHEPKAFDEETAFER